MIQELEADDLVSENPLFRKVFYEVSNVLDKDIKDTWKYFINHTDGEINQVATNLLSEKYVESKRWTKAGAFMEREEEILDILIPKIVSEYKFRKIKIMQAGIEKEINIAARDKDDEKVLDLLATMTNLKKVEKILAEKLGSRTIN